MSPLSAEHQAEKTALHQRHGLDSTRIPAHIAVIMDGNGRWAKKRGLPRTMGHKEGANALNRAIRACATLGISYLSVYVFSTENWRRPEQEVSFLMDFFKLLIKRELPELKKAQVRVRCLGATSQLDAGLKDNIRLIEDETAHCDVLNLNLLINYGSQNEIVSAVKTMAKTYTHEQWEALTPEIFGGFLYTSGMPNPDILIRTGGDFRLSNFLLWQLAYSEFFFLDTLWPDFNQDILIQVLTQFQNRDRRFGGVKV
ncbi:MAG: polyprenyl diphosphate synthase [Candidatus Margulisiibacteriota bacterium]